MIRALALLLILANVCFWFWAHYVDVPELRLAPAAIAPGKQPPRLLLASEGTDAEKQAALAQLSCVSVGPYNDEAQAQSAAKRLQQAGFAITPRSTEGEVFAGYWVSLQGFATRADAELALARLRAAGVSDAYVMNEDATPNALSLGLFADQSHAQQRRDAITKLGFSPQLQNRMRQGQVHWLDVALQEPGQLIDPTLLQPESDGINRLETQACPAALAAGQAGQSAGQATGQANSQANSQASSQPSNSATSSTASPGTLAAATPSVGASVGSSAGSAAGPAAASSAISKTAAGNTSANATASAAGSSKAPKSKK